MYKLTFIAILCIVLVCGCKKSCYTCFAGPYNMPIRYDSSFNIIYDTLSHHNDTLLMKVDTIFRIDNMNIHHICPGNVDYDMIANHKFNSWSCGLDQ
jgi:hypothetical protein